MGGQNEIRNIGKARGRRCKFLQKRVNSVQKGPISSLALENSSKCLIFNNNVFEKYNIDLKSVTKALKEGNALLFSRNSNPSTLSGKYATSFTMLYKQEQLFNYSVLDSRKNFTKLSKEKEGAGDP